MTPIDCETGMRVHTGTAGWSIHRQYADEFPAEGSHLVRYAARMTGTEINSSFYRSHKPETYARWAASVPADFRFSVKLPRRITHGRRLHDPEEPLRGFLDACHRLEDRLGPLLVQLPPSLAFDAALADEFFAALRAHFNRPAALEPRHASWFEGDVEALLQKHQVSRVAADPAIVAEASRPGGWPELAYFRLHGAPKLYYSAYAPKALDQIAAHLQQHIEAGAECWCIFDNTAAFAALGNALRLQARLREEA